MNNQGVIKRIFREVIPEDSSRGNTVRKLFSSLTEPWFLSLIRKSDLFDRDWYLSTYPEIARDKLDPYRHYLRSGWREGCDPGPKFSNEWYLSTYDDVRKPGLNPLVDYLLFGKRDGRKISNEIEDALEDDKAFLNKRFQKFFNHPIDFNDPKTLPEKLHVYILYYRNPLITITSDKVAAREYVASKCGEELLVPVLGIYEHVDDIPIDDIPAPFVIKANHGSQWNIFCVDKKSFDWHKHKALLRKWLRTNYYYRTREWAYKDIKPKVIIEKMITSERNHEVNEFGIYCFGGEPKYIHYVTNAYKELRFPVLDLEWKLTPFQRVKEEITNLPDKPIHLPRMLEISRQLSADFPFARINFYDTGERLFCGEITLYNTGGNLYYDPPEWNEIIGSWFDISSFYKPELIQPIS